MIVCKVCGTQNEVGAQFCGNCGSFLEWSGEAAPDETSTQPKPIPGPDPGPAPDPIPTQPLTPQPPIPNAVICRVCGTPNEPERVFCKNCANELAAGGAAGFGAGGAGMPPPAPTASSGGGIPRAVLGGIAAVVVVVVAAGVFLGLRGGTSSATPTPSSDEPTTAASSAPPSSPAASSAPPSGSLEPSSAPPSPTPEPSLAGSILVTVTDKQSNNGDIGVFEAGSDDVEILVTAGNTNSAAWSPDKSQFVYVRDGGLRIADADGSNDRMLTPAGSTDGLPEWSPDGLRIAFSSRRDGGLEVYTMTVKSRQLKQLTNNRNDIDDRGPTWSPDSKRIAFVSNRSGDNDIWVMSAAGKDPENLTGDDEEIGDVDPAWSPDGSTIIWASTRNSDTLHLWYMDPDGSNPREAVAITDQPDHDPDWSPDGNFITFHRGGQGEFVLVATKDGKILQKVEMKDDWVRLPAWR